MRCENGLTGEFACGEHWGNSGIKKPPEVMENLEG